MTSTNKAMKCDPEEADFILLYSLTAHERKRLALDWET